ncbi:EscU/YscU/HrcU family type III secretion system export apparatus switch protein [Ammoniphilus sp. CFH 90114]|uniref:EscU/YscU/HrcU family type III secretion system export apparatus switch protein n=1 Tax=Ammoniphilus sp. CFH 90114 TaxID=2493665 RepID=UPI00100E4865|nr:EscU/YscU/HrcU family type III secretion system export apparatus switch protein [Ammoniphilus sp. CFH 90114]RXT15097.1 hypothetical protein EIZ39_02495 [Ammoniphilus sp. CFH 90114]
MSHSSKPTKRAVAVTYSNGHYEAPLISAKGKGGVADSIIKKAHEHGIPIQEDKALVEVLSKIELNQQIPPELFQVVAEVLASVYRMEKKARGE